MTYDAEFDRRNETAGTHGGQGTSGIPGTSRSGRTGEQGFGSGEGHSSHGAGGTGIGTTGSHGGHDAGALGGHDGTFGGGGTGAQGGQHLGHGTGHGTGHDGHDSHGSGQHGAANSLLPHGEHDKLSTRLQHAVNGFVDGPRRAVEEADGVLEEAIRHLTDALAERRRGLRSRWEGDGGEAHTEDLRLALRSYREMTERVLRI